MGHSSCPAAKGSCVRLGTVVIQYHITLKKTSELLFQLTHTHEVVLVLGSDEFWSPFFSLRGNLQRQR